MRPATGSSCTSGIHADPDDGDTTRTTRSAADLVATLYDQVLPNPHPVRLESRKGQENAQLAPLNPLYVRRFAAEIARHFEALAVLLPRLQDLCPREVATLLAHVVEVFARSPSPTYRALLLGFLEAADWPLLAAATATGAASAFSTSLGHTPASVPHHERSSSSYTIRTPGGIGRIGTATAATSSSSSSCPAAGMARTLYALIEETGAFDTRTRTLAWRALGLLAEPTQPEHGALVDRLLTIALPSVVPDEPVAAAMALHALCRRHPPLLRVLLPELERVLGGAEAEAAATVELLKTCRYTPLASLSSKERKALWMKLRDLVLEQALPRLAGHEAMGTALGCLATMAGTRIMRRRILRSGAVDTAQALVSEEHQEALAPILLTILPYAHEGAALSEDLAAHAAGLVVQLVRALPAAPARVSSSNTADKPSLHQRLIEQAAAALLARPAPQHAAACRHRARFLGILAAIAAAHKPRWSGTVLDVFLHDDVLAWVAPAPGGGNSTLSLAWCQAMGAALGGDSSSRSKAAAAREAKALTAMAAMVSELLERMGALLSSYSADEEEEQEEEAADVLDSLLALASAGRRATLEAVWAGTVALLQEHAARPGAGAGEAAGLLVRLTAALAAVDVWGVVEGTLLAGDGSQQALQLLLRSENDGDRERRGLAAVVALLRAARGTAADQEVMLALLLSAASAPSSDEAMEVDGQQQGPPHASIIVSRLRPSGSGWARYRLGCEAFLHGYFPLAQSLLAPLLRPSQLSERTTLWLGALCAISQAEAALLRAASPVSTSSNSLERREEAELTLVRPALRKALALLRRLEEGGVGGDGDSPSVFCSSFTFHRRFLQARIEFLLLTATLRAVLRELQLGGRPPGHKHTRHHRHHLRLPRACQRLEGRLWRLLREGFLHDPQTRWTLRSLLGLIAFLRRAIRVLVLQQPLTPEERGRAGANPHWPANPSSPANRFPIVAVARALDARIMQEGVLGGAAGMGAGDVVDQGAVTRSGSNGAAATPALPSLQASLALMANVEASLAAVPWPYPRLFLHPSRAATALWSLRLAAWKLGPEDVAAAAKERPLPAAPPATPSMACAAPPPPSLLRPPSAGPGRTMGSAATASSSGRAYNHQQQQQQSLAARHHGVGGSSDLSAIMAAFSAQQAAAVEEEDVLLLEAVHGQPAAFAVAGAIKGLPREALHVAHVKLTATVLKPGEEDEREEDEEEERGGGVAGRAPKRWSSGSAVGCGNDRRRPRRRSSGAAAIDKAAAGSSSASSSFYYREVLTVPLCLEDGTFPGAVFKLPAHALPRCGEYPLVLEAVLVDGGGRSWVVPQGRRRRGAGDDGRLLATLVCVPAPVPPAL